MALRQFVEDANEKLDEDEVPWTVSLLLERWLLKAITTEEINALAKRLPEFKGAAETWLRFIVVDARETVRKSKPRRVKK